jgi:stage III sporulation protein AD
LDIFKIIGIAILTTFAYLILKPSKPEIATFVSIAGGIAVFLLFAHSLQTVVQSFTTIARRSGIENDIMLSLLKIIGIGYITEFSSAICTEAGNQNMAQKILLGGKVVILVLALPIISGLVEIVVGLI